MSDSPIVSLRPCLTYNSIPNTTQLRDKEKRDGRLLGNHMYALV